MDRRTVVSDIDARYRHAFLDWLACAVGGLSEARRIDIRDVGRNQPDSGAFSEVVMFGTAGHILDYDDTYPPGLSHLSAATAPVALSLGARLGLTVGQMLAGYAAGFEAMSRFSEQSHPALYNAGWHPTAVCGSVGAAVTASRLLGLSDEQTRQSIRLALLTAGGLRTAFGSHGKPLQVGFAAGNGMVAAKFARSGAQVPPGVETGPGSFYRVYGGDVRTALSQHSGEANIAMNWLKAYPCCLQTHAPIDAGRLFRQSDAGLEGHGIVVVHPVSRQAAPYDDVSTGLEAKFSIPYTTAQAMLHGAPDLHSFDRVIEPVQSLARRITVRTDDTLEPNAAVLVWQSGEEFVFRVDHARGSPSFPMTREERAAKVTSLAGPQLLGVLDDPSLMARKVADVLTA